MQILKDPIRLDGALRGAVFAIGNFDGVHRGHQAVLARTAAIAAKRGAKFGAITFEPHPRRFFRPETPPFTLTPFPVKAALFEKLGLDLLVGLGFDADMAAHTAEDFISEILVERLGVAEVVVGYDFHFGQGRRGTPALLAEWGQKLGFGVTILDPVGESGTIFSSSAIRDCLTRGAPKAAADLMGHWWSIRGTVMEGDKRGRMIGFPTANIALGEYLAPALGVYAIRTEIAEGVANIGRRPTFGATEIRLEAFLFDFSGDLYGRVLNVALVDFLRPERKFDGLEALKTQIAADAAAARACLSDPDAAETRFALRSLRAST